MPKAIRRLQDEEFDRLCEAVFVEQMRRGKKESYEKLRKQRGKPVALFLPSGKLNAIRAAFQAGVKL